MCHIFKNIMLYGKFQAFLDTCLWLFLWTPVKSTQGLVSHCLHILCTFPGVQPIRTQGCLDDACHLVRSA